MNSFKNFLREEYQELVEKLITFNNKPYPKYGNVVIMAGGAGSGKGFVKDKLVGIEGFTFDVDELKRLASKTPLIIKKVKDELGIDLEKLSSDLRNPDNVAKLHEIIGDYLNLDDKRTEALYRSIMQAPGPRKPNLIFDVTLKDLRKLEKITRQVKQLGYDNQNIHIVWVVNDIEVAKQQNVSRDRTVPAEILINTHRGVSSTMQDVLNMGKQLDSYMDGDIVFAFNKVEVDSDVIKSGQGGRKIGFGSKTTKGGMFIQDANYFYVKKAGRPVKNVNELSNDLRAKIQSYVPQNVDWA